MSLNRRYPKTPYWPYSPAVGRAGAVHSDPSHFVGKPVVVTEKLDGSNTLLHAGKVYARGDSAPCQAKWMAMAKKHHAWKVTEPDVYLYGEDIYAVHSISYGAVREDRTFYAFALFDRRGAVASFTDVEIYAQQKNIPIVPVLFSGRFDSVTAIREFLHQIHDEPSVLGGDREGAVLRLASEFPVSEFRDSVCKSVRAGHVQTDEHWTRNWRACKIAKQ